MLPWLALKVVNKFVDRLALATEDGELSAFLEKQAIVTRQLAWLKRDSSSGAGSKAWRPRQLHRVASRRWFMLLDNAVDLNDSWMIVRNMAIFI